MNSADFWSELWLQTPLWRISLALISSIVVGIAYFQSLRWSINHLNEFKHKMRMFALVAIVRISLFLGIMVLVCERNIILILTYVIVFFITKMIIVGTERNHLIEQKDTEKND
ncbi:MAG: hypothetical protein IJ564_06830 [Alphaproteobacteria bacterium]|nr:hypothetical protein [Alphaproteobacteria bacterium]MBR3661973.1 hypothetical protein [Alphaproteobacteria bacterium]